MRHKTPTVPTAASRARQPGRSPDSREPARSPRVANQPADPVTHPPDVRVALDAFRRIVQALRAGRDGDDQGGLGSAQLFALQQIAEHPGASINSVAELTCTHQSSVSVVIQRLVEQKLVGKVASSTDRRQRQLVVTAAGRRLLSRAPLAAQGHLIAAIAALPAAERRMFAKSLGAVAQLIAPGATLHPPMFFEDHPDGERRPSAGKGGRRTLERERGRIESDETTVDPRQASQTARSRRSRT